MSATLYVSTMPKPDETVVNVQAPRMTNYSWTDDQRELEITTLVVGSLTIQFDNPAEARAWLTECATMLDSTLAKRDPLAHIDLRTFVHPEPADPEPMSTAVGTVPAAAAPVEPGSFSLCLEESGGYLCTRPVGHEDEHVASGVHSEHIHGGSVRWPQ